MGSVTPPTQFWTKEKQFMEQISLIRTIFVLAGVERTSVRFPTRATVKAKRHCATATTPSQPYMAAHIIDARCWELCTHGWLAGKQAVTLPHDPSCSEPVIVVEAATRIGELNQIRYNVFRFMQYHVRAAESSADIGGGGGQRMLARYVGSMFRFCAGRVI